MIITLTANPALDVTYRVERLVPGESHRVTGVRHQAGGKGFNVSRVLHGFGVATRAIGPAGGALGDAVLTDLIAAGIPHALLPVAAHTRKTVTVVSDETADGGEATVFNEPGGPLGPVDWERLVELVADHLAEASVLVCSGSLPPPLAADSYARLVTLGHRRGVAVVVDTSGPALIAAATAGADVVKPNAAELRASTGAGDPLSGARALRAAGAGAVVVSLGPEGILAVTNRGDWRAVPPYPVAGNPTGAGDAAVAALADGTAERRPWPERLRTAVAWSAAAVAAPLAGSVDRGVLADILEHVRIEPL